MVDSSEKRRASRIWWTYPLLLVPSLGASIGDLGAQERPLAHPAVSPENEVVLTPAPGEISVRTDDLPNEAAVGVPTPVVRYLIRELIARRLQDAQLNIDLAASKAEDAEIEHAAREKETALTPWIGGLHDELSPREAEFAYATAALAKTDRRHLSEQARATEASARAYWLLATMSKDLKERVREMATMRSASKDLRKRLGAAEAELKRKDADNDRLATELDAARRMSGSAAVMAESQTKVTHAVTGDAPPEYPKQPTELLFGKVKVVPTMPRLKPRLRAGEVQGWALASDKSDGGPPAPAEAHAIIEDPAWVLTHLRNVGVRDWELASDKNPPSALDSPEIPDAMSTVVTLPPLVNGILVPGERGVYAAAAHLAEGLRATREEAILQQQERVFTVDVEERSFAASSVAQSMSLDPALDIRLLTAKSELVGESAGGIRFFPDGSSTGGRIELELLGDRAVVNVRWSTGAVMLER